MTAPYYRIPSMSRFSLPKFMASQSDGFFYDFTRTDRHFQEHTGPTLADDVGEAMGLALDQRSWDGQTLTEVLAAQTEIFSDPGFSSGNGGWYQINAATVSVVSGRLRATASGTGLQSIQIGRALTGLTAGRTYRVELPYVAYGGPGITGAQGCNIRVRNAANSADLAAVTLATSVGTPVVYFVATAASHEVRARIDTTSGADTSTYYELDNVSAKLIPGNHGTQSTGTMKPTRQTSGAKFDGSDDYLLTTYYAVSGANFIAAAISVPATISATQVIAGASGAAANRTFLSLGTSGRVTAGVGSNFHTGVTDLRGTDLVIAMSYDGSSVRLFAGSAIEKSEAQGSTPTTTIPYCIGALNSNGIASNFTAATVKRVVAGREFLTLERFKQIAQQLQS